MMCPICKCDLPETRKTPTVPSHVLDILSDSEIDQLEMACCTECIDKYSQVLVDYKEFQQGVGTFIRIVSGRMYTVKHDRQELLRRWR